LKWHDALIASRGLSLQLSVVEGSHWLSQAITLCRSQDVEEYLNEAVRKTKYPDLPREVVAIMLDKYAPCVVISRGFIACLVVSGA